MPAFPRMHPALGQESQAVAQGNSDEANSTTPDSLWSKLGG